MTDSLDEYIAAEWTQNVLRFIRQRCRFCGRKQPDMDLCHDGELWYFLCEECWNDEEE